jgi:hypothetical protein
MQTFLDAMPIAKEKGLLLCCVEPSQHFARTDLGSNVHQPLAHASAEPEREVGALKRACTAPVRVTEP